MQEWTVVSPFAFARLEETTWNLGLVFFPFPFGGDDWLG